MERAIAYIRVSDERQVSEGNSLITQGDLVREFAKSKKYEFDRLFTEEGESAKTDARPVLQELLSYVKVNRGMIQVLIVPKIDRLARNLADYINLKLQLERFGVRIESVGEQIHDTPVGRFTEGVLASVAQFDNEIRAERCKGGMIQAVRNGRWVWKAPIGFRNVKANDKATIAPDDSKAPYMIELFIRLASGRERPKDVLTWLATQGIKLSSSHFYRLVHNTAYIGLIEKFGLSIRGQPPMVPLVSDAIFHKAHEAFRTMRHPLTYQRDNPEFPLRGTVRCTCSAFLTASFSKGRRRHYPYYRCVKCSSVNLRKDIVEESFAKRLCAYRRLAVILKQPQMRAQLVQEWQRESAERHAAIRRLERELSTLSETQRALALKNAQGVIPDELAKAQIAELDREIRDKHVQLDNSKSSSPSIESVIDFGVRFLSQLDSYWNRESLPGKKMLQSFFYPSGVTHRAENGFRTAESAAQTEEEDIFLSRLSPLVDHRNRTPKQSRGMPPLSKSQSCSVVKLLSKLYEQFHVKRVEGGRELEAENNSTGKTTE